MSIYDQTSPIAPAVTPQVSANPETVTPIMNSAEASTVLNQYGVDPNAVLTASNISNTLTRPTSAPDDLLGIRSQINFDLGLDAQNKAYQDAMAAARARVTGLNKTVALMDGQRVNMGVIRGQQAQERNLATPEIQALQDQAYLEQDKLNALTQERDYRLGVAEKNIDFTRSLKLQYPGANIKFGDSLDGIEKKLVKYQKEQKKEAEKDAIKATARSLGIKTKGRSAGLVAEKLRKYYKSERDYENAIRAQKSQSDDISLALQKIQLQKAQQAVNNNGNDVASYYTSYPGTSMTPSGMQSIDPSLNQSPTSYWDYLK